MTKLFLTLALTLSLGGCNGKESAGIPGDVTADAATTVPVCQRYADTIRKHGACNSPGPADERLLADVLQRCELRAASLPAGCEAAFDAMYDCDAESLIACDDRSCAQEARDYSQCASGGTCGTTGGGTDHPAQGSSDPVDRFTTHELCQCIEGWEAGAPGDDCNTFEDCTPTCCACPGSDKHYTASVCDKSATGGKGIGKCATPEATCAPTDRCD